MKGGVKVRLKEGVDATDFCKRIRPTMQKELCSDSLFVCKVQTMNELIDNRLRYQSVTGSIRRYISLAIFFMASLCLGTIGEGRTGMSCPHGSLPNS